jgi:SAM-dependent methyltransferase
MGCRIYGRDFAAIYDAAFSSWSLALWPFLRREVGHIPPRTSAWLDLCCGTGSLLKLVARRGFMAVGLDRSAHQLRHARRNVAGATFRSGDVRTFTFPRTFNVITCLYDSVNYLLNAQDVERTFRNVRRHLAPGGLFVFDVNTRMGLEDRSRKIRMLRDRDWTVILQTSFDEEEGIGRFLVTGFVKAGRTWRKFEEEHRERGYQDRDIEALLARNGFSFRKFDAYTLSRPRKRSGRLLYLCEIERAPRRSSKSG